MIVFDGSSRIESCRVAELEGEEEEGGSEKVQAKEEDEEKESDDLSTERSRKKRKIGTDHEARGRRLCKAERTDALTQIFNIESSRGGGRRRRGESSEILSSVVRSKPRIEFLGCVSPLAIDNTGSVCTDGRSPWIGTLIETNLLAPKKLKVLVDDLVAKVTEEVIHSWD